MLPKHCSPLAPIQVAPSQAHFVQHCWFVLFINCILEFIVAIYRATYGREVTVFIFHFLWYRKKTTNAFVFSHFFLIVITTFWVWSDYWLRQSWKTVAYGYSNGLAPEHLSSFYTIKHFHFQSHTSHHKSPLNKIFSLKIVSFLI